MKMIDVDEFVKNTKQNAKELKEKAEMLKRARVVLGQLKLPSLGFKPADKLAIEAALGTLSQVATTLRRAHKSKADQEKEFNKAVLALVVKRPTGREQLELYFRGLDLLRPFQQSHKTAVLGKLPTLNPQLTASPELESPYLDENESAGAVKARTEKTAPSELAQKFMSWLKEGLANHKIKHNEAGAAVHFVPEGMVLVSPRIFKDYAADAGDEMDLRDLSAKVQRELIKCGWHLPGPNRSNIVKYAIQGRGGVEAGNLSCVVLVEPGRWVHPVPPSNPALVKK